MIAFDSFSAGANTRLETCTGLESDQKADQALLEWYEGLMGALDPILPQKFCLFSTSSGCYPMSLYARRHANRIDSYFMGSPIGVQNGPYPDPFKTRFNSEQDVVPSRSRVESYIYMYDNKVNMFEMLKNFEPDARR